MIIMTDTIVMDYILISQIEVEKEYMLFRPSLQNKGPNGDIPIRIKTAMGPSITLPCKVKVDYISDFSEDFYIEAECQRTGKTLEMTIRANCYGDLWGLRYI